MTEQITLTKLRARKDLFTSEDIDKSQDNYEGKMIVLYPSFLNEDYKNPQNQLLRGCGGFGCHPEKIGTKVFGTYVIDGVDEVTRRNYVMGVIKNSVANEVGLCPCGNELHEDEVMNALSRVDNETYICKSCEGKELQKELESLGL